MFSDQQPTLGTFNEFVIIHLCALAYYCKENIFKNIGGNMTQVGLVVLSRV